MSICPVHFKPHFSLPPVSSYSVRTQLELTVPMVGPNVWPTSPACSAVRQRALTCGDNLPPFTMVLVVTFHCPGAIEVSDAAATAGARTTQNIVIQNLS